MEILNARQGSPEWSAHRASHFNASDAPAMMGVSKYKSRSQLLHEMATGIPEDHDDDTQKRFADGHAAEALARPLAEKIIGQDLYPVTGYDEEHSASFDGLTVGHDIASEHKSLNDEIRACKTAADLHPMYRIQMEQQLKVSGAGKCLFMASKWKGDELVEEKNFWYEPDLKLRAEIIAGWKQFAIDLANYTPPEVIPAAVAAPIKALPAVSIKVEGAITLIDNLPQFGEQLAAFIAGINKEPKDDQAFAEAEAAIKTLKAAQAALESEEARALSQTASIDEMRRTVALYADQARTARLMLENLVKTEKERIRLDLVQGGRTAFASHVVSINNRLGRPYMPVIVENFAGVIKGKKTIASLRDACDTELARLKIEANSIADKIQFNLNTFRDLAKGYEFLFADTAQLVLKADDDFVIIIKSRIVDHKEADAKRIQEAAAKLVEQQNAVAATIAPVANHEPVAIGSVLPPVQRISAGDVNGALLVGGGGGGGSGIGRLRALIDQELGNCSAGEMQQVLDAVRGIKAGRIKAAQA